MMTGGRALPYVRHERAYRAHEPDIHRAAEGLSRAASAAIAGAADAGVRARHRTRRRNRDRQLGLGTVAQRRSRNRPRGATAHRRSGAVIVPTARTVSARRKWTGTDRSDPPLIAAPGLAMAEPRWSPRRGARVRRGAGANAASWKHIRT